jgi:proteasome lid subunit RPN8/RPN11
VEPLTLTTAQVQAMITHARAVAPFEACGLLGGVEGRVRKVFPMDNALQSRVRYHMDPEQLFSVLEEIEERGWGNDPLGIFHSHPQGPTTPSVTDVAESYYPNSVYILIAYPERPRPSVRGFRIVDGDVTEVPLKILDDQDYPSPK